MRGIFHSSLVFTVGRVKTVLLCMACIPIRGLTPSSTAPCGRWRIVLFYFTFDRLLPWRIRRSAPQNCKAGTTMREVQSLLRGVSNWIWILNIYFYLKYCFLYLDMNIYCDLFYSVVIFIPGLMIWSHCINVSSRGFAKGVREPFFGWISVDTLTNRNYISSLFLSYKV